MGPHRTANLTHLCLAMHTHPGLPTMRHSKLSAQHPTGCPSLHLDRPAPLTLPPPLPHVRRSPNSLLSGVRVAHVLGQAVSSLLFGDSDSPCSCGGGGVGAQAPSPQCFNIGREEGAASGLVHRGGREGVWGRGMGGLYSPELSARSTLEDMSGFEDWENNARAGQGMWGGQGAPVPMHWVRAGAQDEGQVMWGHTYCSPTVGNKAWSA